MHTSSTLDPRTMAQKRARPSVGVVISHPEKVLFPDDGITKGELAAYYARVAPLMLPHLVGRPVTMERFPSGVGQPGFLQKSVSRGFPEWLQRVEVPKKDGSVHYPLVQDTRSLLWLANQNCITPHVWTSRVPDLYHPDVCIFDFDPSEDDPGMLRQAVLGLRALLEELQLASWIKTSGSKGFHVAVPMDGKSGYEEVLAFAHAVGEVLVARDPRNLTLEFSKAERGGRIYVDVGRNTPSATFAAAYAVRSKSGAPVSAPCTWDEVADGQIGPRSLDLRSMPRRIEALGDVWADLDQHPYSASDALARLSPEIARLPPSERRSRGRW
jgi:bifunctional non-homologous end joining protein LigD